MLAPNRVDNLGPKLLQEVDGDGQRNLLAAVAERICSGAWAGKPGCGDSRRCIVRTEIGNVRGDMALAIVGYKTENDCVDGAPLESMLTTVNIANVFVQDRRDRRLNGTLDHAASGSRG